MNASIDQKRTPRPPPADLADVAFLDITDVCSAVRMSPSWVHDEVRENRFPQPMRFGPRCTRWRAAEVRAWLIKRAEAALADTVTSDRVLAKAKQASSMAKAKRATARGEALA